MKKREAFSITSPKAVMPLALITTFLWGCAYPSLKLGYQAFGVESSDIPSLFVFAGLRFTLAGIAALLLSIAVNRRLPAFDRTALPAIGLLALVQTFGQYGFYYVGLANTTGVRASILGATSTFIAVFLSGLLWRKTDQLTGRKLLGCVLGLSGVALVNLGGSLGDAPFTFLGEGFCLITAATAALGSVINRATMKGQDSLVITGWQLLLGGGGLLVMGLVQGGSVERPDLGGVLLMALMITISSVAFTLWALMLKHHPVSRVTIYQFLTPIFGSVLSSLVLGEKLVSPMTLAALALVVLGIVLVNRVAQGKIQE